MYAAMSVLNSQSQIQVRIDLPSSKCHLKLHHAFDLLREFSGNPKLNGSKRHLNKNPLCYTYGSAYASDCILGVSGKKSLELDRNMSR